MKIKPAEPKFCVRYKDFPEGDWNHKHPRGIDRMSVYEDGSVWFVHRSGRKSYANSWTEEKVLKYVGDGWEFCENKKFSEAERC